MIEQGREIDLGLAVEVAFRFIVMRLRVRVRVRVRRIWSRVRDSVRLGLGLQRERERVLESQIDSQRVEEGVKGNGVAEIVTRRRLIGTEERGTVEVILRTQLDLN